MLVKVESELSHQRVISLAEEAEEEGGEGRVLNLHGSIITKGKTEEGPIG